MESQKDSEFKVVTIPDVPGFKITKVIGLVTSDMGGEASYITLVSATGTAVVIEAV